MIRGVFYAADKLLNGIIYSAATIAAKAKSTD